MRRSTVSNWFTKLHRPAALRSPLLCKVRVVQGDAAPSLEALRLETFDLSDGRILDLQLSYRGHSTGRCIVERGGVYLLDPTGPEWARELLKEAVREWRVSRTDLD